MEISLWMVRMSMLYEYAIPFLLGCHWMLFGLRTAKDMQSQLSCIAVTILQSLCH
jgi:hypothetical protein